MNRTADDEGVGDGEDQAEDSEEEEERDVLLFMDPEAQHRYDEETLAILRKRAGKSQEHAHYEKLCYEVDRQVSESRRSLRSVGGSGIFRLCVSNEEERRESSVGRARVGLSVAKYSVEDGLSPELEGSTDNFEFERGDMSAKGRAKRNFI